MLSRKRPRPSIEKPHARTQHPVGERLAGELGALIRIEDLRSPPAQRRRPALWTQNDASIVFDSSPGEHVPRSPQSITATQVEKPLRHRDIGDVRAPHVVRPRDREARLAADRGRAECCRRLATLDARPPVGRLHPHQAHEPPDPVPKPAATPWHGTRSCEDGVSRRLSPARTGASGDLGVQGRSGLRGYLKASTSQQFSQQLRIASVRRSALSYRCTCLSDSSNSPLAPRGGCAHRSPLLISAAAGAATGLVLVTRQIPGLSKTAIRRGIATVAVKVAHSRSTGDGDRLRSCDRASWWSVRLLSDREVEAGPEGQSSEVFSVSEPHGIVDVEESIGVDAGRGLPSPCRSIADSDSSAPEPNPAS